jgi:hypothetical protein
LGFSLPMLNLAWILTPAALRIYEQRFTS